MTKNETKNFFIKNLRDNHKFKIHDKSVKQNAAGTSCAMLIGSILYCLVKAQHYMLKAGSSLFPYYIKIIQQNYSKIKG